jgi:hypothetical protein
MVQGAAAHEERQQTKQRTEESIVDIRYRLFTVNRLMQPRDHGRLGLAVFYAWRIPSLNSFRLHLDNHFIGDVQRHCNVATESNPPKPPELTSRLAYHFPTPP